MGPTIDEARDAISVLPPPSRTANPSSYGADSSSLRMSQPSLLRSQSQHSRGMLPLSFLSQSSFDEILTNDQRLGSEDQSSQVPEKSSYSLHNQLIALFAIVIHVLPQNRNLKGEEDIKANLNKSLKCTTEQLKHETDHLKLQEMFLAFPDQIQSHISGLKKEVCNTIVEEIKRKNFTATRSQKSQPAKTKVLCSPTTLRGRNSVIPKIENVYSKKQKSFSFIKKRPNLEMKQEVSSFNNQLISTTQKKDFTMKIESDKDIDMGLSCLLKEKGRGCISSLSPEVMQETTYILRKARRKRKVDYVVILD